MSTESSPDFVQSCHFTHVAHSSTSGTFSVTGNTPFGLGEGRQLFRADTVLDHEYGLRDRSDGENGIAKSLPVYTFILLHGTNRNIPEPCYSMYYMLYGCNTTELNNNKS